MLSAPQRPRQSNSTTPSSPLHHHYPTHQKTNHHGNGTFPLHSRHAFPRYHRTWPVSPNASHTSSPCIGAHGPQLHTSRKTIRMKLTLHPPVLLCHRQRSAIPRRQRYRARRSHNRRRSVPIARTQVLRLRRGLVLRRETRAKKPRSSHVGLLRNDIIIVAVIVLGEGVNDTWKAFS